MQKQVNEKHAQINELRNYLRSTDYKVIKEAETGYVMPEEIRDSRQQARDGISELEYEISTLEETMEFEQEDEIITAPEMGG